MSDDSESGGDYDLEGYRSEDSNDIDAHNPFFELEAVESRSDSDNGESDDDDDDDDDESRSGSRAPSWPPTEATGHFGGPTSFPQFMQLPPELRHHIWRLFCPDLVAKSRVLEFNVYSTGPRRKVLQAGTFLEQQTAPLRAVLATHRESRALALRTVPDRFSLGHGDDLVPYNKEQDIIHLKLIHLQDHLLELADLISFTRQIKHLAMDAESWPGLDVRTGDDHGRLLIQSCPDLSTVYLVVDARHCNLAGMPWLKADKFNAYHFETCEEEPGLGEDLDFCYCWPDPVPDSEPIELYHFPPIKEHETGDDDDLRHDDGNSSSVASVPSSDASDSSSNHESGSHDEPTLRRSVPLYPLVKFDLDSGMEMFDRLMEWRRSGGDLDLNWDSSSESDSATDEYESEGINDDDIDEESQASDEEDDLNVLDQSEDGSDGGGNVAEHISISSSDSDDGDTDGGVERGENPAAAFSSPEPARPGSPGSSSTMQGDGSESSSSEGVTPVRMVQRSKRRIVSSDAEDEAGDEPVSRPLKRARVVLSDSEEEDVEDGAD